MQGTDIYLQKHQLFANSERIFKSNFAVIFNIRNDDSDISIY